MPGFVGVVGPDAAGAGGALASELGRCWGDLQVERAAGAVFAAHAHQGRVAVCGLATGGLAAVDGEPGVYEHIQVNSRVESGSSWPGDGMPPEWPGNLARWDPTHARLDLGVEATGSFPVYVARTGSGLVFSSRLRPVARMLGSEPDPVGMLSFLRTGFFPGRRTLFQSIERMQPGQWLRWSEEEGLRWRETSRHWTPDTTRESSGVSSGEVWEMLRDALAMRAGPRERVALMLSAGWDSRTLLAGLGDLPREHLIAYTHGDPASREPRLAAALARRAGIQHLAFDIGPELYDLGFLQAEFDRTENVVFPHWIAAGKRLRDAGATVGWAGVYGEVLGGHYGEAMAREGWRKALAVLAPLVGDRLGLRPRCLARKDIAKLAFGNIQVPWYIAGQAHELFRGAAAQLAGELESDLDRLGRRGIPVGQAMLEAFIGEHRGSHYINAQALALRAAVDAGLPFTDPRLLAAVTAIPLQDRIHNRLNRELLRRHAPEVLRLPGSATLLPLSAPLLLQEASRAVRRAGESAQWSLHHQLPSMVPAPRLSWVTLEFLRDGRALGAIVEDLRGEWWDRAALHRVIRERRAHGGGQSMHPLSDQLLKIYTVDLMTR